MEGEEEVRVVVGDLAEEAEEEEGSVPWAGAEVADGVGGDSSIFARLAK